MIPPNNKRFDIFPLCGMLRRSNRCVQIFLWKHLVKIRNTYTWNVFVLTSNVSCHFPPRKPDKCSEGIDAFSIVRNITVCNFIKGNSLVKCPWKQHVLLLDPLLLPASNRHKLGEDRSYSFYLHKNDSCMDSRLTSAQTPISFCRYVNWFPSVPQDKCIT